MPIKNKIISYKITNRTKALFIQYPSNNNYITISQIDIYNILPKSINIHLDCICDHCNHEFNISASSLYRSQGKSTRRPKPYKDNLTLCFDCRQKYTNNIKYNVDYVSQNVNIHYKQQKTNLKRYGVKNPRQNKLIKIKTIYTLYKNNKAPISKQQLYFFNLLKNNELNKDNIQLNYPLFYYNLDIALLQEKINIEYNGGGHDLNVKLNRLTQEQFKQKEIRRNKFIRSQSWEQIFIISPNDKIHNYTDKEYIKIMHIAKMYLLNTNHAWVEIYIEENRFKTSVYEQSITNILNINIKS